MIRAVIGNILSFSIAVYRQNPREFGSNPGVIDNNRFDF